jgi:Tol biopolymer transport system component
VHLLSDDLGAMIGSTRSLASLCLAALATAALLAAMAGCSVIGEGNEPWDTDIPEGEAFDADRAAWGPEGQRIVFEHNGPLPDSVAGAPGQLAVNQLWVADLEAGTRRFVHRGPAVAPDWSPDGQQIAFSTRISNAYVFVVDASGGTPTPLTGPDSPNPVLEETVTPEWSPSGDRLLYTIVAGEPRGISIMKPNGSNARIIAPYGVMGSWFPDGEHVVYVNWDQRVEDTSRRRQIFRARADGTRIEKLTDLPRSDRMATPSVSPDGQQIAFIHRAADGTEEVFLMRSDGTNIRQITQGPGNAERPEWHPEGKTIAFSRQLADGSHRLYLLDVETLEVEPAFPAKPD